MMQGMAIGICVGKGHYWLAFIFLAVSVGLGFLLKRKEGL